MIRDPGGSLHVPTEREHSRNSDNRYSSPFLKGGSEGILKVIRHLSLAMLNHFLMTGLLFCFLACGFSQPAMAQPSRRNHVDSTAPEIISFSINHQDAVTDIHEVKLQLEATDNYTAPGQLQVRFSNDGVEWSDWQSYRTDWEWNLTGGDGIKQVYVEVQDQAGNTAMAVASIRVYVPVSGIALDREYFILEVGGAPVKLGASLFPEHASFQEIIWSSADPSVAVVDQGWVTPVGVGETTVTVTAVEGGFTAACVVKVVSAIVPYEGPILYGDLDGNGEVDAADAVIILRYIVGMVDLDPDMLEAADVHRDGSVNVADAVTILRYIVGLVTELPVDPQAAPPPPPPPPPPEIEYYPPTARLLGASYRVWTVAEVTCSDPLNVRSKPGTDQPILGTVTKGQRYYVREIARIEHPTYPVWYRINYEGNPGWIAANYTAVEDVLYGLDYWGSEIRLAPAPEGLGPGDYKIDDEYNFKRKQGSKWVDTGINFYFLEKHPYALLPLDRPAPDFVTDDFLEGAALKHCPDTTFHECDDAFIEAQETWGINALYLMAHAALESAWGTSAIARDKNNIFGYMAYDDSPYLSAATFKCLDDCIMQVSGFIRLAYLNTSGSYYRGAHLVGMNEFYATDPMWAFKIANIMQSIIDYGSYQLVEKTPLRGVVTASGGLNLRSGPGLGSSTIALMPAGTEVIIWGNNGSQPADGINWLKVTASGKTGWASGQYIELLDQPRGVIYFKEWYRDDGLSIKVYQEPDLGSAVVDSLHFADSFTIEKMQVEQHGGKYYLWYRVNYPGKSGWVIATMPVSSQWPAGSYYTVVVW